MHPCLIVFVVFADYHAHCRQPTSMASCPQHYQQYLYSLFFLLKFLPHQDYFVQLPKAILLCSSDQWRSWRSRSAHRWDPAHHRERTPTSDAQVELPEYCRARPNRRRRYWRVRPGARRSTREYCGGIRQALRFAFGHCCEDRQELDPSDVPL